jgi:hypothetical protein
MIVKVAEVFNKFGGWCHFDYYLITVTVAIYLILIVFAKFSLSYEFIFFRIFELLYQTIARNPIFVNFVLNLADRDIQQ